MIQVSRFHLWNPAGKAKRPGPGTVSLPAAIGQGKQPSINSGFGLFFGRTEHPFGPVWPGEVDSRPKRERDGETSNYCRGKFSADNIIGTSTGRIRRPGAHEEVTGISVLRRVQKFLTRLFYNFFKQANQLVEIYFRKDFASTTSRPQVLASRRNRQCVISWPWRVCRKMIRSIAFRANVKLNGL